MSIKNNRSRVFDPHESLFKLPIVILIMGIIYFLVLASLVFIFQTSDLVYKEGFEGLNNLFYIFKVPLYLVGLSVPIFAILSAFHKSEQTKEQIRLSLDQNNFVNYYKHLEEFSTYFESVNKTDYKFDRVRKIHGFLFPHMIEGDPRLCEMSSHVFEKTLVRFLHNTEVLLRSEDLEKKKEAILYISIDRDNILRLIGGSIYSSQYIKFKLTEEFLIEMPSVDFYSLYEDFLESVEVFNILAEFDHNYSAPRILYEIRRLDIYKLPAGFEENEEVA